jgi:hypothetical protein
MITSCALGVPSIYNLYWKEGDIQHLASRFMENISESKIYLKILKKYLDILSMRRNGQHAMDIILITKSRSGFKLAFFWIISEFMMYFIIYKISWLLNVT